MTPARAPRPPRPPRSDWFARLLRAVVAPLVAGVFRTRVVGADKVPDGAAILAGNHVSYADPVLLWCRSPRPAHFMAKSELWGHAILAWGLDRVWAFPVRRGTADRDALSQASELLRAGELVGIFPEGTRDPDAEAQGGAAFLAIRNGVPVVPVGISGTDRIMPPGARIMRFPRVTIRFGEPIDPASVGSGGRKERVAELTAAIMRGIAEQLEAAEGGEAA